MLFPWRSNQCLWVWWFSWGGFLICVRYHQCMRFQFHGDFSGVDFVSVSDIISACDFKDKDFHWQLLQSKYCCRYIYTYYSLTSAISVHVLVAVFWILIHIFTPVNVVVSLDWPELPHRKGVWKYEWLMGHISMVRCGICAVSTLRMCFYACRISLISGLLNEDLICWIGSWNCRGYSVIGICFRISTGGCKQFCTGELIFRYLEFVSDGICFRWCYIWM